jgi:hypothetical protein
MKTSKPLIFTLILLTSLVSLNFASGNQTDTISSPQSVKGTISYLEGDVFLNNKEAQIGDAVISSDTLQTGEASFCEVVFEDANIFRLDELTITRINWTQSDILLEQGGISAVFNKLDKLIREMKDFTISSPTTVAGVRGTVFYARVEDADNTYVCICNGELNMEYGEDALGIEADHHKAYRFTNVNGKVSWTDAPMLYHDDPKMDALASGIDYTIPWGTGSAY